MKVNQRFQMLLLVLVICFVPVYAQEPSPTPITIGPAPGVTLTSNVPGLDLRPITPGRGELRLIPNGTDDIARGELTILNSDVIAHPGIAEWLAIFGFKDGDGPGNDVFLFQSNQVGGTQRPIWFDSMGGFPNVKFNTDGSAWFYNLTARKMGVGTIASEYDLDVVGYAKFSAGAVSPNFYGRDFGSDGAYTADTNIKTTAGFATKFKFGSETTAAIDSGGLILKASDGANCFRVTVNNAGVLSTAPAGCP